MFIVKEMWVKMAYRKTHLISTTCFITELFDTSNLVQSLLGAIGSGGTGFYLSLGGDATTCLLKCIKISPPKSLALT